MWIERIRGDAAHVIFVACDLGVSVETPTRSPAVLDEPVVEAVLCAVADHEHRMIEACARARHVRINATCITI